MICTFESILQYQVLVARRTPPFSQQCWFLGLSVLSHRQVPYGRYGDCGGYKPRMVADVACMTASCWLMGGLSGLACIYTPPCSECPHPSKGVMCYVCRYYEDCLP